jgi:hypothetical protein
VGVPVEFEQAPRGAVELSRGAFLRRSAGAAAVLAGATAVVPRPGRAVVAGAPDAKPIPGGFSRNFKPVPSNAALHVFAPAKGGELNVITDFDGFVAAAEIQGKARGSDGSAFSFDCDMRFMQGSYVALDGQLKHGTFGFI